MIIAGIHGFNLIRTSRAHLNGPFNRREMSSAMIEDPRENRSKNIACETLRGDRTGVLRGSAPCARRLQVDSNKQTKRNSPRAPTPTSLFNEVRFGLITGLALSNEQHKQSH